MNDHLHLAILLDGYERGKAAIRAASLPCGGYGGEISGTRAPRTAAQSNGTRRKLEVPGESAALAELSAELQRLERRAEVERWGFPATCAIEMAKTALRLFARSGE